MNYIKNQLILLEKEELFKDFNNKITPNPIVIQNPFQGIVRFVASESDKLQILINATYNMDYYNRDDVIKYSINRFENELNIKFVPELPEKSVYKAPLIPNTAGLFITDLTPLYILVSVILLFVISTFILSIAFASWWNKHKRPESNKTLHYKIDADSTKHPLLISEPNTPHIHDQIYGNFLPPGNKDQQQQHTNNPINSPDVTVGGGGGGSGGSINNTIHRLNSPLGLQCSIDGATSSSATHTLPFMLTGGGFNDYPNCLDHQMEMLANMTGRSSYDNLSNAGALSSLHRPNSGGGSSLSGPPTAILMPMMGSNMSGRNDATNSSLTSAITSAGYSNLTPINYNLLYSSGSNTATHLQSSNTYFSPNCSYFDPNSGTTISSATGRLLIPSTGQTVSSRHLAKEFLDDHFLGLNVLSQISEKDISDFNNSNKCPLDSSITGGVGSGIYQQLTGNTGGQGSDETSGILSDSSGSTLDKPAQSSNAKINAGFSIVPSVIERYVSLDANDQRYIPLSNVIAEVAQCPQHSYLVQGTNASTTNMDWMLGTTHTVTTASSSLIQIGAQIHPQPKIGFPSVNSSYQTVFEADSYDKSNKKMVTGSSSTLDSRRYARSQENEYKQDQEDTQTNSSSPKSALKSNSRSNSKVSKQLRFTTFGFLCFFGSMLITMIHAQPNNQYVNSSVMSATSSVSDLVTTQEEENLFRMSSVNHNTSDEIQQQQLPKQFISNQINNQQPLYSYQYSRGNIIQVDMTIFLPRSLLVKSSEQSKHDAASGSDGESLFKLYLNESSKTQIDYGQFERSEIDVYDVRNSLNILAAPKCRQRYSCTHSCDPGNGHKCICQRGFKLASDAKSCRDFDECSTSELTSQSSDPYSSCAAQFGPEAQCDNRPGTYQCSCNGQVCRECQESCPVGYFKTASCSQAKFLQCKKCRDQCSAGYYISRKCTATSNTQCRACRPLCITGEFEMSPCTGYSNRICKNIASIPGLELPDKKNIWFEDRRYVKDINHFINYDEISKASPTGNLIFDRSNGYQIHIKFLDNLTLKPILEPVDHSQSNDNHMFRAHPTNNTLKYLCPYPVPPTYSLNMIIHYNVTTDVVNDANLPGYRATLHPCKTYIQHGNYPNALSELMRVYGKSHWSESRTSSSANENNSPIGIISCLEPGKLPIVFGDQFNEQLAIRDGVYVEEKHHCARLKSDCRRCLVNCAHTMISQSLQCKPTGSPADNGRSPRLALCYDCCVQENCTTTCQAPSVSAGQCRSHLCLRGPRMDIGLEPDWPQNDKFICHVRLSQTRPVFRLKWWLIKDKKQLTMDEFHEQMLFTDTSSDSSRNSNNPHKILGTLSKVFRGLIHVNYTSNIGIFPDIISGNTESQQAYIWNSERLPLGTTSAQVKPDGRSASIKVWPNSPLGVNSGMWSRLAHSSRDNCQRNGDLLVNGLNNHTANIQSIVSLPNLNVERGGNAGRYSYRVSHAHRAPSLEFRVPADASLLGAIFSKIHVHRKEFLSAALHYLDYSTDDSSGAAHQAYWIIELSGQVSNFPGYFRLKLWNVAEDKINNNTSTNDQNVGQSTSDQEPLLDYDIGVFEQKQFKLHLRVPSVTQPEFDKTFLLQIIDNAGQLLIYVHRAQQNLQRLALIDKYLRNQDGKYQEEPSILPEVMSVSGQQSLKDTHPLGISPVVMFSIVGILVTALLLMFIGHLTRKEEHLCEDIIFRSRHLVVFVMYMTLKSMYCFSVTVTALLVVMVIYTREPYLQLTTASIAYNNNNSVAERLLMSRMDWHLQQELGRQLQHVVDIKTMCDARLNTYYDKLNERLEAISAQAAKRRSRILISQAVVERAQYELKTVVDQLMRNLEDFNKTANIYMKKIQHDMQQTREKLINSEWLEGARLIYQEVLRRRNEAGNNGEDPTKPFLSWLKISGQLPSNPPQLTLPSSIPLPDWMDLDIDLPVPTKGSGLDAEYGPAYVPFSANDKDLQLEQSIWSYYDPPSSPTQHTTSGSEADNKPGSSSSSEDDSSNSINKDDQGKQGMIYMESIESIYRVLVQLSWHHLLALTLLLDILWLLHRAAHTVDTAEQIIYGYPCFIDCTIKGKRRRRRNENNLKFMLKRTFCEIMESSFVPKFCASAFALFMIYLLSIHLNELISEEVLDYIGYYDNMALPAHLRNRFVNSQVVQSARQLNEYELSGYEQFLHQRQSEIHDILHSWIEWTAQLEQYQCDILTQYKTTEDGKLISDILNKPNRVPIPTHCRLTELERDKERENWAKFKMDVCPVKFVTPELFTEYNETSVSMQIVKSSRHWLQWTRKWVDVVLQCVFCYVAALVLWNTLGATVWFFVKRFSLIRQKRIYETDFQAATSTSTTQHLPTNSQTGPVDDQK